MINPQDIENKQFSYSVRGYNREEVDQFLDEIMLDYLELINDNNKLRGQVNDLKAQLEESRQSESSVMNTLEQAKSLMSDISASAEKRAEVVLRNAQLDADKIVSDARDSVETLEGESANLKKQLEDFKARYRKMLNDELSKLEAASSADFFQDLEEDFFPASMTGEIETPEKMTEKTADIMADKMTDKTIVMDADALINKDNK